MKLGILLRYAGEAGGPRMDLVLEAERLGYQSAWAGESYGTDAVTPIAWVLARTSRIKAGTGIMQMPARTPACAAMTAATLQAMSGNRFLMGIGPSGPQVIEGWHGVRLRQAAGPHARSTSPSCARSSRARRRCSTTASTTRSPMRGPAPAASASR